MHLNKHSNIYEKDKLLLQLTMWEQDKSKTHIFFKHMTILYINMIQKYHWIVLEQHFPFLDFIYNYKTFIKPHKDISDQNMDGIYHATLNSHNLSFICPEIMVMYFLESLRNCEQLCYKHLELNLQLTRSYITNNAIQSGFRQKLEQYFKPL